MSASRTFVEFDSDFPDDSVFSDSGELAFPGGRNMFLSIINELKSRGVLFSEINQYKFYGWEIVADINGSKTWLLLQGLERWLLIIEDRSAKKGWFNRPAAPSIETLNVIDDAMKNCENITNISWFSRKDYESGRRFCHPVP